MPTCRRCNNIFPSTTIINGTRREIHRRKFCLDCNPYGQRTQPTLLHLEQGLSKQCTKCKKIKTVSCFHTRTDGHYKSRCKGCENKNSLIRSRQRKQDIVNYMGNQCYDCGNVFPACVYDCHHLDPTQKDFAISAKLDWKATEQELDKCVLLCSNCHRIRHHQMESSS